MEIAHSLGGAIAVQGCRLELDWSSIAVKVGIRFPKETNRFVTGLAKGRARSETPLMQRRIEQAWRMRWSWLLGCAAAKAVVASLLEMQGCVGIDGASPAVHEVERDFRYAGLAASTKRSARFSRTVFHFIRVNKRLSPQPRPSGWN